MNKVFLDANIVLDFLDSDRAEHKTVRLLFEKLVEEGYRIFITEDILTTLYYVVKNKTAVLDFFCYVVSEWEIVCFGTDVIKRAITICRENSALDFEDVCQALAAKSSECRVLITNDAGFYETDGLELYNANEFLGR